ncbi:MAG TPA: thiamine diphosphokinase [Ktedonobacteraceae bacterium]
MHVVIFAGGTLRPGKAVNAAIASADLILAADSGASTALQYGITPAIVVGDFDSLGSLPLQQLQEQGSKIIQVAVEKDETDTELAIDTAIEHGATRITLLGALGGPRFDHTMANVMLLAGYEKVPIQIVDGPAICWLVRGPGSSSIEGDSGDLLSLIPLTSEAIGVRTDGLYYPLHGETLHFGKTRGVSNVLTGEQAEVSLEQGLLLVIHSDVQELTSERFRPPVFNL